jgi:hypothetical protein
LGLASASVAHATRHACSPSDTSFPCRLDQLLQWLDAAAIVLVLVLLAVIVVAIHLYRKNRPQTSPTHREDHRTDRR